MKDAEKLEMLEMALLRGRAKLAILEKEAHDMMKSVATIKATRDAILGRRSPLVMTGQGDYVKEWPR